MAEANPTELDWYSKSGTTMARSLNAAIASVERENDSRMRELFTYMRLYSAKSVRGLKVKDFFKTQPGTRLNPISLNIVKRIVGFARNKIGKSFPAVKFLTDGSDWEQRQRAKELGRLVEGAFTQSGAYQKALVALTHGCLLGTGALKVIEEDDRLEYEWVFPGELFIPLSEQVYGEPRTLYQSKQVDRAVLCRKFPEFRGDLEKAETMVEVWEAWRLPSLPSATDGRHAIVVPSQNVLLLEEDWEQHRFPFAFFQYDTEPIGFWSTGLGASLLGAQFDINLTLRNIQENIRAGGNLKVLAPTGSVALSHLTNEFGAVIPFSGAAPTWMVTPCVHPDVVNHLSFTITQAWEESGFNQFAGSSQKPVGLNSGIALRTWDDQQSERQALLGKAWESFWKDLATLTVEAAQRLYERNGDFVATWVSKSLTQRASMKDAMLDSGLFEIKTYGASRLPDTPSGRLELVQELSDAGLIEDKEALLRLLDFPDVESELNTLTASIDLIDERLAQIVKGEVNLPPHDRMDLALAKKRANLLYCQLEAQGAPPEVLDRVGAFADQAADLLAMAQAPASPPAPPPESAPLPTDPTQVPVAA